MLEFVADTARDSSSEGKHRSELDSGVFSNSLRNRFQLKKSIPSCREGSHSLTARHKCALQGRDGEDSHRSREAGVR